jgi:hypothetical protein
MLRTFFILGFFIAPSCLFAKSTHTIELEDETVVKAQFLSLEEDEAILKIISTDSKLQPATLANEICRSLRADPTDEDYLVSSYKVKGKNLTEMSCMFELTRFILSNHVLIEARVFNGVMSGTTKIQTPYYVLGAKSYLVASTPESIDFLCKDARKQAPFVIDITSDGVQSGERSENAKTIAQRKKAIKNILVIDANGRPVLTKDHTITLSKEKNAIETLECKL